MQVLIWIALGCGGWLTLALLVYAMMVVSARCAQAEEDAGIARRS